MGIQTESKGAQKMIVLKLSLMMILIVFCSIWIACLIAVGIKVGLNAFYKDFKKDLIFKVTQEKENGGQNGE